MLKTQVRPSRDLRNNYADVVKSLKAHDHVVITNNGVGEAVLIGIQDFEQYEEYLHRRFIYEELQKSKAKMSNPNAIRHDADDVYTELEQILGTKEESRTKMAQPVSTDELAFGRGCMKGKMQIAEDFDAPLDDFKEYML